MSNPVEPLTFPGISAEKNAEIQSLMEKAAGDLVQCIQVHGFDKLAAAMFEMPDMDVRSIGMHFGVKIAQDQLEWSNIVTGLHALAELKG